MCKAQIGVGCRQELQQRAEVVGLQRGQQATTAVADERNAGIAQSPFVVVQVRAPSNQQQHVRPACATAAAVLDREATSP